MFSSTYAKLIQLPEEAHGQQLQIFIRHRQKDRITISSLFD